MMMQFIVLDKLRKIPSIVSRLKFISKRIRGFDQSNEPDEFVKRFIGMEISLFAKVLSYLI